MVQSGGVNAKYKAKFRSLSFNLKDPKNPDLRAKVRRKREVAREGGYGWRSLSLINPT